VVKYFYILLFLSLAGIGFSQSVAKPNYIQLSGVLVDGDSLKPIPYASVLVMNSTSGAITDYKGFFTVIVKPSDQVKFYALGYKEMLYTVPDTVKTNFYSSLHLIQRDTFDLPVVEVRPYPSKDDFKSAFVNLNIQDDFIARGIENMERAKVRALMYNNYEAIAALNYQYFKEQQINRVNSGGYQGNNFLNPVAWYRFVQGLGKGKYKRK
jgi:sensor histidine kinase YesM